VLVVYAQILSAMSEHARSLDEDDEFEERDDDLCPTAGRVLEMWDPSGLMVEVFYFIFDSSLPLS
jgi:hypothetical protein